jgi:hypothetical protein
MELGAKYLERHSELVAINFASLNLSDYKVQIRFNKHIA